jgi:hypothetical protein
VSDRPWPQATSILLSPLHVTATISSHLHAKGLPLWMTITQTESLSLTPGTAWGLAALLVGCSLLISACALMVFNVTMFGIGLRGVNKEFDQPGGVIGALSVALLGVCSTLWGYRGWSAAVHKGESTALGGGWYSYFCNRTRRLVDRCN